MSDNTNTPQDNQKFHMSESVITETITDNQHSDNRARVWAFHYDLYGADGNKIESSKQGAPVMCLEGERGVLLALQDALQNKVAGDDFSITIPHGKAYGRHYPNRVKRISRKKIDAGKSQSFHIGQIITLQGELGPNPATVVKVGKFNIDVDLNHPLAGVDLTFDVLVMDTREATDQELQQGFAANKLDVE